MNGLLVFNSSNDIVFQHLNAELCAKIRDIAQQQGLLSEDHPALDANTLLQIFSPIINSQKIMFCQFDNTYSSFQCENNLNFAFGDFLGYSFIKIGQIDLEQLKRQLGICIALARNFYGPNLFAAQANAVQAEILSECINCYEQLYAEEQAYLLEALPHLIVNAELRRLVNNTLDFALDRLRERSHPRAHALMFVAHKFVGARTTKPALTMCPSDLLFLSLLTRTLQSYGSNDSNTEPLNRSVAVFLQGESQHPNSGCVPCIAHITRLKKNIVLVQVIEYANLPVASNMYDTFFVLHKILSVQQQGDFDAIRPAYESLETFVRQTLEALKRAKLRGDDEMDTSHKKFAAKWENLRKMYSDYLRSYERELLVRIESNVPPFTEDLKQLFTLSCCDSSAVALDQLTEGAVVVEGKMLEFAEFLAVKAERNLTIEAYLEDFPGLVHFIYVCRSTGAMVSPDLLNNKLVPKERLWGMVQFARNQLKKGQSTVMWKDKVFNYSYFLWFEEKSSGTMKSIDLQQHFMSASSGSSNQWEPQHEPGLLASDYYQQLTEVCFPKLAPGKVKCYELYCIHLGLVTGTCAVEHARRLVATISDVVNGDTC